MMNQIHRRKFLAGLACGLVVATPAAAQDYVADIVSQLKQQGFSTIVQERTLLGRVRILASSSDGEREIILNPNTGEILRDLWIPAQGSTRKIAIVDGTDGTPDDDDDEADDDEDDDDDDDEDGEDGGGDDDDESDDDDDEDDDSDEDLED